jgi:hypothetical protein
MNQCLKDMILMAFWGVAIIGGLIAAFVAIIQLDLNVKQRKNELRWRKANAAKESINDIHSNNWSRNAVTMLDWSEGKQHRLKFEGKDNIKISYKDNVIPALGKLQSECSDLEQNIVDCFDWFFYFIDRIEHYRRTNLIEFEDVKDVFSIYSKKIKKHEELYENFMKAHSYELAIAFWKQFDVNKPIQPDCSIKSLA